MNVCRFYKYVSCRSCPHQVVVVTPVLPRHRLAARSSATVQVISPGLLRLPRRCTSAGFQRTRWTWTTTRKRGGALTIACSAHEVGRLDRSPTRQMLSHLHNDVRKLRGGVESGEEEACGMSRGDKDPRAERTDSLVIHNKDSRLGGAAATIGHAEASISGESRGFQGLMGNWSGSRCRSHSRQTEGRAGRISSKIAADDHTPRLLSA